MLYEATLIFIIWFLPGLIGAWLFWFDWVKTFNPPPYCPTPRAIFCIIIASAAGVPLFFAGLVVVVSGWLSERPRKDSWWTRPICKRD